MSVEPAPQDAASTGFTVEQYFALVDEGRLDPDDRVELLEGVVVSMSPANSPHATAVHLVAEALHAAVGERAAVRIQAPLVLGRRSVPEPDVALVTGRTRDYTKAHPTTALLVVEVADSSLGQDRLTKTAIYAAAGIPEYWIVNLREDTIEVHRMPERAGRRYGERDIARAGDRLALAVLPGVEVAVADMLPTGELPE
jgi:Uma2 family endonuclease